MGLLFTLRKHWKKSAFAGALLCYGINYSSERFREYLIRREFCFKAAKFGSESVSPLIKPRRLFVIINPAAGKGKCIKSFKKNAAPLFYLAGIDVTYVQSCYEGHAKVVMNYIDPTLNGIVIVGGDGIFSEVITGMFRHNNDDGVKEIPVGFIPFGKSSNFIFNKLFKKDQYSVKDICNATMAVIEGTTKQVDVMEIKADKKSVFAVSSLHIGAHEEVKSNISNGRFWWFGAGKKYFAFMWRTVRDWPYEFPVRLSSSSTLQFTTSHPTNKPSIFRLQAATCKSHNDRTRDNSFWYSNAKCECCKDCESSSIDEGKVTVSQSVAEHSELSSEAILLEDSSSNSASTEKQTFENSAASSTFSTLGLSVYLESNAEDSYLNIQRWRSDTSRQDFIRNGWEWMKKNFQPTDLDICDTSRAGDITLVPPVNQGLSFSIDGETFDAKPIEIILHKKKLNVFAPSL